MFVFTNVRYKTYQTVFFLLPGLPKGGTLSAGVARWLKIFFFKHNHVAYQIDEDEEQNRVQVKFSS